MEAASADLSAEERADGFRALARALGNQLGRLEVDDAQPELAPFNLWRQKFYMDNPDCLYWVAEIAGGGTYRIDGVARNAAFTLVNVYAGQGLEAQTVARITGDELVCDAEGRFTLTLGGDQAGAAGQWVPIPAGANMVWVRQFYDDPATMDGDCAIVRVDDVAPPPSIEAQRFTRRLRNMGLTLDRAAKVLARSAERETDEANAIREWSEDQSGAVYRVIDVAFTELAANPVWTARALCAACGVDWTLDSDAAAATRLDALNRQHGAHRHSAEDFGLDRDEILAHFAGYRSRFGLS